MIRRLRASLVLWQQYFAGHPSAIGREIVVNGTPMPVVGVTAHGFRGTSDNFSFGVGDMEIWVPLAMAEVALRDDGGRAVTVQAAGARWFNYFGRLAPGAMLEQAQAQASTVAQDIAVADSGRADLVGGARSVVSSPLPWHRQAVGIAAIMAVPLIVLAIACINGQPAARARHVPGTRMGAPRRARLADVEARARRADRMPARAA